MSSKDDASHCTQTVQFKLKSMCLGWTMLTDSNAAHHPLQERSCMQQHCIWSLCLSLLWRTIVFRRESFSKNKSFCNCLLTSAYKTFDLELPVFCLWPGQWTCNAEVNCDTMFVDKSRLAKTILDLMEVCSGPQHCIQIVLAKKCSPFGVACFSVLDQVKRLAIEN